MKLFVSFPKEKNQKEKPRSVSTMPKRPKNKKTIEKENDPEDIFNNDYDCKTKLPHNFADELLYWELELEKDTIDINVLNKLLQLYTLAIGYYDSIHDNRYLYFKNKLQSLWIKNNVIDAMTKQITTNEKTKPKHKTTETKQKESEIKMNMEYIKKNKKILSKEILDQTNNERKAIDNFVCKEMSTQENDIIRKLNARKNRACSLPPQKLEPKKLEGFKLIKNS